MTGMGADDPAINRLVEAAASALAEGDARLARWLVEAACARAPALAPILKDLPAPGIDEAAEDAGQVGFVGRDAGLRMALRLAPSDLAALSGLGAHLCGEGRPAEGLTWLSRAVALAPRDAAHHSNLLLHRQYDPRESAATALAAHRAWDHAHAPVAPPPHPRPPRARPPRKRLRIGYLSPNFCRHPVGFFLHGVLPHHDRDAVEVHCYSDRARPDRHTRFLRAAADRWTDCAGLDDAALTRRIGADGIDILVDLAGHTGSNRLPVFARRAAPVQATWAGYVGTTGLAAMDFLIADRHHVPPGREGDHAETVIRLPDAYVCYAPPDDAPAVSPPPCLGDGIVTFGSFNNLAKVNDQVLALWAVLLRGRPRRRLRLRSPALTDPATRARVRGRLGRHGVAPDQIVLEGATAPAAMLAAYGGIDIALDPFPYSGGVTTLEALWMGVPVVTLAGDRFCSRHSTAHLTVAGHPELICDDPAAYLALAEALAADPDRLCRLRARLRDDLAASKLCDGILFTRGLEAAYRTMWDTPFNLS